MGCLHVLFLGMVKAIGFVCGMIAVIADCLVLWVLLWVVFCVCVWWLIASGMMVCLIVLLLTFLVRVGGLVLASCWLVWFCVLVA